MTLRRRWLRTPLPPGTHRARAQVWCAGAANALGVMVLLTSSCAPSGRETSNPRAPVSQTVESVSSDLGGAGCRTEVDRTDPNETPYQVCPGPAGYALNVRRVGAGQRSVDVVDPAGRVFPLHLQDAVGPSMFSLAGRAEWRVVVREGDRKPTALIVRVDLREDARNPDAVTSTLAVVAKMVSGDACVTDVVPVTASDAAGVAAVADGAAARPCRQPPTTATVPK